MLRRTFLSMRKAPSCENVYCAIVPQSGGRGPQAFVLEYWYVPVKCRCSADCGDRVSASLSLGYWGEILPILLVLDLCGEHRTGMLFSFSYPRHEAGEGIPESLFSSFLFLPHFPAPQHCFLRLLPSTCILESSPQIPLLWEIQSQTVFNK